VLGDGSSKIVDMPDEKITLLEVMANSNGVNSNSQLNNIMVIRETDHAKQVKHLNLQDPSIFTSPWYYLQPNDIVVVKPNEEKIIAEQKKARNQLYFTTVLSATTFIFLVIDRITR
jgi:polysaccharide export outer membrane protein